MRTLELHLHAPDVDPDRAYALISDFARYPSMVDTVREVVVDEPASDGSIRSAWTVRFRTGLLQWTERDVLDPVARTIDFRQITGDFHEFHGQWRLDEAAAGGTMATFTATFDLGMATLEAILDPIALSTLHANIVLIARGLLGAAEEVQPQVALDPA